MIQIVGLSARYHCKLIFSDDPTGDLCAKDDGEGESSTNVRLSLIHI